MLSPRSAVNPDRIHGAEYVGTFSSLIDRFLSGEPGRNLIISLISNKDDPEYSNTLNMLLTSFNVLFQLPTVDAQQSVLLALYRFRRAGRKIPGFQELWQSKVVLPVSFSLMKSEAQEMDFSPIQTFHLAV
jgi:hypothetical protein